MNRHGLLLTLAIGALVSFAFPLSHASAQTDAGGLLSPWPTGLSMESETDAILENAGHVKEDGDSLRLGQYESQGRWKLIDTYKINPTIGYDAYYLDINSRDPRLPKHLVDASVGFATPLAKVGEWFFAASGAVGYAGNAPMTQGSAYYGKATVLFGKELGPDSNLIFGLDYNGNRAEFPDLPLPGFAYTKRINPTLLAAVGFPYTTLTWTPVDYVNIKVKYTFPELYELEATYNLTKQVGLFVNLTDEEKVFHLQDAPHDHRLFFEQQRAETGVRWEPISNVSLLVAGGYAFNTKFDEGFNAYDAETLLHSSEEAYVRIGLELRR